MSAVIDRASVSYAQCQQMAEEEFCADLTEYAAWLDNVGPERSFADGLPLPMSAQELHAFTRTPFRGGPTALLIHCMQVYHADMELTRRYLADMSTEINKRAQELCDEVDGAA